MGADYSVLLPILHAEAWQRHMTACAIEIMRSTTAIRFELVVAEAESDHFAEWPGVDRYVHFDQRIGYPKELNAGLDACTGDRIAVTGNDVFMRPGWLEELARPFDQFGDCGATTLASSDLKCVRQDLTAEGIWGPLMCFDRVWRYDEDYPRLFIDTDLVMRIYEQGLRSYRNWRVVVGHLNQGTHATLFNAEQNKKLMDDGLAMFKQKHQAKGGHLLMFRHLTEGNII